MYPMQMSILKKNLNLLQHLNKMYLYKWIDKSDELPVFSDAMHVKSMFDPCVY